ncbi:16S rRNA (uracil(1498)-N(3))-methyltransferase [Gephyromycinifex aptenodytis]|uniref:16S rRNA (uracil(1498)-N(3))-methyltransferase n=1 Tax=Gephyromycinifex aptenodytis TaxID=2716227 RepID=UPI0014455752|nr:16S rRNA (uracil(1498)-N(3))-methyltransferase [Gephyromycinifex aptenodytis]
MTAALYRCPLHGAQVGSELVLDGAEGHHAATVKRTAPGEKILLADGSGQRALAEVLTVQPGVLQVRILELEAVPDDERSLILVQALAKGGRDEQAIEAATELGVDEVWAWQAERSIVRWRAERTARARAKWEAVVDSAAKQARRATIPRVDGPLNSAEVGARIRTADLALILHEDADQPLAGRELPVGQILVVVGPEGGISPAERALFEQAGAVAVRLGANVLRSGTAGPAALAVIAAATRWR